MKGTELLKLMSDAKSNLIEESENISTTARKKIPITTLILPIAGVVVVALLAGLAVLKKNSKNGNHMNIDSKKYENLSSIIYLENDVDLEYHSANAEDRIRYGLPSDVSDIRISQEDIGEYIGVVGGIKNNRSENIVGKKAYHYSKYPENNSIIVVDLDDSYAFFCSYGYKIEISLGETLTNAFAKYDLPEKGVKIEIYNYNEELVRTITQKSDIEKIIQILDNCRNIGYAEQNRRLVQAWNAAYDNDYIYLNQESGAIEYKDLSGNATTQENNETKISVGIETKTEDERLSIEDLADELWHKDSLILIIEVSEGYRITLIYCPVARTISAFDGSFDLTEEKMKEINSYAE